MTPAEQWEALRDGLVRLADESEPGVAYDLAVEPEGLRGTLDRHRPRGRRITGEPACDACHVHLTPWPCHEVGGVQLALRSAGIEVAS